MEVESKKETHSNPLIGDRERRRRRWCVCASASAGVVIGIVLLVVILALTAFKSKHPVTTINHVALQDLHVSVDIARLGVNLNLTLDADLTVHNPNKVGFKYKQGSAVLNYRGQAVGEAPLPAGEISADGSEPVNISLTIMGDRLLSNSQLYSDAISGTLPFNAYTTLSGKVIILGVFKVHVLTTTSCDLFVFLGNRTVGDQKCSYNTKL